MPREYLQSSPIATGRNGDPLHLIEIVGNQFRQFRSAALAAVADCSLSLILLGGYSYD